MVFLYMYRLAKVLTIVTMSDPTKAARKPSTAKPSINEAANQNKKAFITNRKRPRVSTVIGKVNNTRIGLTKRFSKPITMAAMRAV